MIYSAPILKTKYHTCQAGEVGTSSLWTSAGLFLQGEGEVGPNLWLLVVESDSQSAKRGRILCHPAVGWSEHTNIYFWDRLQPPKAPDLD